MKAVVMAGGEGTRLRPLTSNQPKPMVPIVGKPCMEHILELLRRHELNDVVVTLAFMPQAIRSYFGDGEALGMNVSYSVEESPLGTAGSVRQAVAGGDEPVLVISGDALCDIDLTSLLAFHRERKAAVTIALKSVENPLEFGIVVTDSDGRIERFLEKPSWGQVFSDTINTGIYVIEPEVLRHVPAGEPYDFSKQLFPLLLEMGRPLYGYVADGYWQDVGDLGQYAQANFDALDGLVQLEIPGFLLRGNVWLSPSAEVADLDAIDGPAFVGNYCRILPGATVGPYSVLSANVTLRERARTTRSVIDSLTHIGRSTLIEGAIVGRSCDIRSHVRIHEGVAIGDEVTIGDQSTVFPNVRIYPHKEIESGAQIRENLIWESRAPSRLFEKDVVSGLVEVDLTPEIAARLGAALGTMLERGAHVVSSREATTAARIVKRSLITGLNSTGVDVADLRVLPAAVGRHLLKMHGYDAGFHVGTSTADPEVVQIRFFEQPGIELTPAGQKEVEKHFFRQDFRRAPAGELGDLDYPPRVGEAYAEDLLTSLDSGAIRERKFRIVVDYGYSAASAVLPLLLEPLQVEAVSAHAVRMGETTTATASLRETIGQAKRLVGAIGADLAVVFDRAAERLYLVDETGHEIAVDRALLLFVRLLAQQRPPRQARLPGHGDEPGRGAHAGERARGDPDACLPGRADQDGGAGRRRVRRRAQRRLRVPRLPAGLRRCREPVQAARAARAGVSTALGARRRAAGVDPRPPPAPVSVGDEGARHARSRGAAQRPRARPGRRRQAVHRSRLGAGAARPRRADAAHLRRGADGRGLRAARGGATGPGGGRPGAGTGGRGSKLESQLQG